MAYQKRVLPPTERAARHCLRHGCKNTPTWRVATKRWWNLNDKNANDGITGIVFEVCDDHCGAGWPIKPDAPQFHAV